MTRPFDLLLVEDNPADADLMLESFAQADFDIRIHHVCDGVEAIAFLRQAGVFANAPRPDLVLLDLNLPRRDGRAVLDNVKKDPDFKRIPIIVLSSSSAPPDILASYDLGANSFITKPVGLKQFQDIVDLVESYWFDCVRLPTR